MILLLVQSALSISLHSACAETANLRGHVSVRSSRKYLVDDNDRSYVIEPENQDVTDDLVSLGEGDYIIGHGELSGSTANIDTIEFIGLQRLIGKWLDRGNGLVVDFKDFNNAVFRNTKGQTKLQYALAPDELNRWTIFLGDDKAVVIGILSHFTSMVRIDLINSDTGEIDHTMRLSAVKP